MSEDTIPDLWKWKRLRNIAFGFEFWPLEWRLTLWRQDEFYGGISGVAIGPFRVTFHYAAMDGAVAWLFGPHCEMDVSP